MGKPTTAGAHNLRPSIKMYAAVHMHIQKYSYGGRAFTKNFSSTVWGYLVERRPNRHVEVGSVWSVEAEQKQIRKYKYSTWDSLAVVIENDKRNTAGNSATLCAPEL